MKTSRRRPWLVRAAVAVILAAAAVAGAAVLVATAKPVSAACPALPGSLPAAGSLPAISSLPDPFAYWDGTAQDLTTKLVNVKSYTTRVWMRAQTASPTGKATLALTANGTITYLALAQGTVNSSGWTQLTGTTTVSWTGTIQPAGTTMGMGVSKWTGKKSSEFAR